MDKPTTYPHALAEQSKINASHDSLLERRTSRLGCQSENGQTIILEKTISILAKSLKFEEISTGVERLMKLLYKIKSKVEANWVDILDLKAVLVVFSIHKDFTLKYESESISFYVSSNHDIVIQPWERLCIFMDNWWYLADL